MESLQIARRIVAAYSGTCFLTNLKLNLLVYWCQVEALRQSGEPLFTDEISVGQCGPVRAARMGGIRHVRLAHDPSTR